MDMDEKDTTQTPSKDYFLPNFLEFETSSVKSGADDPDLDFEGLSLGDNKTGSNQGYYLGNQYPSSFGFNFSGSDNISTVLRSTDEPFQTQIKNKHYKQTNDYQVDYSDDLPKRTNFFVSNVSNEFENKESKEFKDNRQFFSKMDARVAYSKPNTPQAQCSPQILNPYPYLNYYPNAFTPASPVRSKFVNYFNPSMNQNYPFHNQSYYPNNNTNFSTNKYSNSVANVDHHPNTLGPQNSYNIYHHAYKNNYNNGSQTTIGIDSTVETHYSCREKSNAKNRTSIDEINFPDFHVSNDYFRKNKSDLSIPFNPNMNFSKSKNFSSLTKNLFDSEKHPDDVENFMEIESMVNAQNTTLSEFIKTQRGSRILQRYLNNISQDNLNYLLEKLKGNFKDLMNNIYGNYFSQKLFQVCISDQRVFILKQILKEFVSISCNISGTHSMQSLMELVNMKEEEELVKEAIKDPRDVIRLSLDVSGTHVIQKIMSAIKEENRSDINSVILSNLEKLVLDSNGVCVVKKFINENLNKDIKLLILKKIEANCLEILQNPFGNYIIQHVFDVWSISCCGEIFRVILNNISSLSMQKFSSNVIEKSLDIVDSEMRKKMLKELFNSTKIASLIKNKFGMFVLQKAIDSMSFQEKAEIKDYLTQKLNLTSKQEKTRLLGLIDLLN